MVEEALQCDVAIVGYGPGAQCLAALLARAGRTVIALERYPHMYNLPRAGHIDHETVRLVQSVGDVERFVETLWEVRDEYVWLTADRRVLMLQPAHETGLSVSGWYSDYSQWQPILSGHSTRPVVRRACKFSWVGNVSAFNSMRETQRLLLQGHGSTRKDDP